MLPTCTIVTKMRMTLINIICAQFLPTLRDSLRDSAKIRSAINTKIKSPVVARPTVFLKSNTFTNAKRGADDGTGVANSFNSMISGFAGTKAACTLDSALGTGVAVLLRHTCAETVSSRKLKALRFEENILNSGSLEVFTLNGRRLPVAADRFLSILKQEMDVVRVAPDFA